MFEFKIAKKLIGKCEENWKIIALKNENKMVKMLAVPGSW